MVNNVFEAFTHLMSSFDTVYSEFAELLRMTLSNNCIRFLDLRIVFLSLKNFH
jgi:hypothetical protein